MLKNLLLVMLGGGVGSALRFAVGAWVKMPGFPLSTLAVNVVGSFVLGALFAVGLKEGGSSNLYLLLGTGLCGGFTTFSTFSLENVMLLTSGHASTAILNMVISVVLGIFACLAGYKIFI